MTQSKFEEFVHTMARLRGEGGCPWDREQTYETLKNFLIEETYEAVEAIEDKDHGALCEELGDVLLEVVFLAQIAREENRFTIDDVIDAINTKMVRRHPHVFGDTRVADSREVLKNWEEMKQAERAEKRGDKLTETLPPSILDGVTRRIPAVLEASQLSQRAARVGFDWSRAEEILDKLHEELEELRDAMRGTPQTQSNAVEEHCELSGIEDEIGDIIFVAVNLARHFKIDPESALKKTNQKFRNRFRYIENMLARSNRSFEQTNLEEMERYWQEAKRAEPGAK
ncbi:MAG: nucleoside triphosphate pyrophosphohydrolase [Acidobacteriia bacterium]|nr:nucleoside triphosphate pyrophosphohydrolase [Terriglobia bacterium]